MADVVKLLSPRRIEIVAVLSGYVAHWASLSDLNRSLRERGLRATTETELSELEVPTERFLTRAGKTKAVHVYAYEAAREHDWRRSERKT